MSLALIGYKLQLACQLYTTLVSDIKDSWIYWTMWCTYCFETTVISDLKSCCRRLFYPCTSCIIYLQAKIVRTKVYQIWSCLPKHINKFITACFEQYYISLNNVKNQNGKALITNRRGIHWVSNKTKIAIELIRELKTIENTYLNYKYGFVWRLMKLHKHKVIDKLQYTGRAVCYIYKTGLGVMLSSWNVCFDQWILVIGADAKRKHIIYQLLVDNCFFPIVSRW